MFSSLLFLFVYVLASEAQYEGKLQQATYRLDELSKLQDTCLESKWEAIVTSFCEAVMLAKEVAERKRERTSRPSRRGTRTGRWGLKIKAFISSERCVKSGSNGVCKSLNRCQTAIDDIRRRINPQICSFDDVHPIVCCLDGNAAANPLTTTIRSPASTITEYIPPMYDYETVEQTDGQCAPIPESLTLKRTGQKALDKCIEYQEKYVYPCVKGLQGELSRRNRCQPNSAELIFEKTDAAFPHMVMLGYGSNITDVQFLCGGTLISDRYVLTAGHCIANRDLGPVTYVLIGVLKRSDVVDSSKIYKVKNIIKHPEYKPSSKYNDILLIETEKTIPLNEFLVPACLPAGDPVDAEEVLVIGWGLSQYNRSDTPQKEVAEIEPGTNWNWSNWLLLADKSHQQVSCYRTFLHKFSTSECKQKYQPYRLMKQGFDEQSQTCYGDKTNSKTCQSGDSGGPIQIKSKKIHCMYNVVGVTSFGSVGEPGVYTRVLNYVPWIESIVWPN